MRRISVTQSGGNLQTLIFHNCCWTVLTCAYSTVLGHSKRKLFQDKKKKNKQRAQHKTTVHWVLGTLDAVPKIAYSLTWFMQQIGVYMTYFMR